MVQRIIPDVMKEPLLRQQAEQADTETATRARKETARAENVNEGCCPSCGEQMRLSTANGIPVHVCMQHSVVMPIRDPATVAVTKVKE